MPAVSIRSVIEHLRLRSARAGRGPHFVRAAVVGTLAGLVAVAFQWALTLAEDGRERLLQTLHALPHADAWGWIVLPLIAAMLGCLAGWLVQRFEPDAAGSGIPHVKGVLLHLRELRWRRLIPVKFVGGVMSVGSGLSMGREGPTVQMGAAIARMVADVLRLPPRLCPQLISCGAGAGVAAAFNAPLAGFLFVLEELHREMSSMTFGGALVAALAADVAARSLNGQLPSFSVRGYPALPLSALPAVALLGAVCGAFGVYFNKTLLWSQRRAAGIRGVPRWALPGLAASICGLVAWWMPAAVGGGHATAQALLEGRLSAGVSMLAAILAAKFVLTMMSYASGAPGGVFAPMLLMGALLGMIAGHGLGSLWPEWAHHRPAFAMIAMAAVFTGCVRAPLTGMVLILEMTANYNQLLALGVACLTAYAAAEALRDPPLYESLLAADLSKRGVKDGNAGTEPRSVVVGIQRASAMEGKAIMSLGLPAGCLIVGVERGGREILPTATLVLLAGDHITVLVPAEETDKALRIVDLARQA